MQSSLRGGSALLTRTSDKSYAGYRPTDFIMPFSRSESER